MARSIPGALPTMTGEASGETIKLLSGMERPEHGADDLRPLEPEFASDLLTVKARPLKLAEQHPDVLAAQLRAPVVSDRDRRPRMSKATVAARASRHLGKVVREQPADQRSLGKRHTRRL
jgi:hypothetical protein